MPESSSSPTQFATIKPTTDARAILGAEAQALLAYESKTVSKAQLPLPGPAYIARVFSPTDRS
ncbi:MAG: hypothetical protein AABZ53_07475, partial [Planctomycetota bacterium]